MRPFRTFSLALLVGALSFVAADNTLACKKSSAMVSGSFNETGAFVIASALDSKGNALEGVEGYVVSTISTAEGVTLSASNLQGQTVYLVGDLDFDKKALYVASFTPCAKTAEATVAAARLASGGCQAKAAAHADAAVATATTANASGCCAAKAAKAAQAGGSEVAAQVAVSEGGTSTTVANAPGCCAAKAGASAATANASGCAAKTGASAATANASGCAAKTGASAATANASGCAAKAANASSCGAKSSSAEAAQAASNETMIVFTVSGLTCGGCCAKVESAIAALALAAIKSCQVDLEKGQASVTVTEKVDTDALKNAIVSAGFTAELVESKEARS